MLLAVEKRWEGTVRGVHIWESRERRYRDLLFPFGEDRGLQ